MANQSKFSPEQLEFLVELIARFVQAQHDGTTADFQAEAYESFVARWPNEPPTLEQIQVQSKVVLPDIPTDDPCEKDARTRATAAAEAEISKQTSKRIYYWFYNRVRSAGPSVRAKTPLLMKTPKPLQDWQVYQLLYYTPNKAKQEAMGVDYEKWITTLTPEERRKETYFTWLNRKMKEELKESETIQKEVADYMAANKTRLPPKPEDRVKGYDRAIRQLPASITTVLEKLVDATGWSMFMFMGGPTPRMGGVISTVTQGRVPEGKIDFFDWVGKEWLTMFSAKFDEYLADVFSQKERDEVSLLRAGTPASDAGSSSGCSREQTPVASPSTGKRKRVSNGAESDEEREIDNFEVFDKSAEEVEEEDTHRGPQVGSKSRGYMSQYEIEREANIERNRLLLESLGMPQALASLKEKPGPKEPRAPQPTAIDGQPVPRRSSRITPNADTMQVDQVGSTGMAEAGAESSANDTEFIPAVLPTPDPSAPALDIQTPSETSSASTGTELADERSTEPPSAPTPPVINNRQATPEATPVTNTPHPAPVEEKNEKDTITDVLRIYTLPPWISEDLIKVMKVAIPGKLWKAILSLWIELECCSENTNGSLPTAHRPAQVSQWTKAKCIPNKSPKDVTASTMATAWRVWWYTIQPPWRKAAIAPGTWPFPRECPNASINEPWAALSHHGPNGFLYVVLCLTWWGQVTFKGEVATATADAEFLELAVADVHWVVAQMALAAKKKDAGQPRLLKRRRVVS